jgi:hypothetical protein
MAAGDAGSPKRYYSATAVETTITAAIPSASQGDTYTSFVVASTSGFAASFPYTLLVNPDTNKEEVVTVESGTGTTLTVKRGQDNTQAVAHSAGATVRHAVSARDFRELQTHIASRGYDADSGIMTNIETHVHGLGTGDGSVVGTAKAQTLSNKTLSGTITSSAATFTGGTFSSGTITSATITSATITSSVIASGGIAFEGSTVDGFDTTLTVTDPTANRTITLPNVTGTVAILDASQTISNKILSSNTLGSDLAAGGFTVSGLATPSANSDAATKAYVDTQVSSLVDSAPGTLDTLNELAAALGDDPNFATTVTNSIATKLSLSGGTMTGAIAMGTNKITGLGDPTSAQDAATKNYIDTQTTSAAASATAAALSAADAATSATSAATSASSAATTFNSLIGVTGAGIVRDMGSITETDTTSTTYINIATVAAAAATSASSASASQSAAATSATSAATSATSAAASATAAATSATSAAASATAAATSASSAQASSSAAATSATSAATSATSAAASASAAATSETNASASASLANNWATLTTGPVAGGEYSAKYHAQAAATSATSAATSATSAATSATSAAASATAAATSASSAAASESAAATSAASAAASAALLGSAVLGTIADAKGDLLVASAADTFARLAVGTDGYILTASSTATNGVTWASAPISLPSQSGNGGKYLTTDGSTASWAAVETDPLPSVLLLMGA